MGRSYGYVRFLRSFKKFFDHLSAANVARHIIISPAVIKEDHLSPVINEYVHVYFQLSFTKLIFHLSLANVAIPVSEGCPLRRLPTTHRLYCSNAHL